jgi:hypothetical protein
VNMIVLRGALVAVVVMMLSGPRATGQAGQRDTVPRQTLVEKLLRIAGLTATPSQMKAPGEAEQQGALWIADLGRQTSYALTTEERYRSPVYSPGDTLYALRDDSVVRVSSQGAAAVAAAPGVAKLVGFDPKAHDEIIVLFDGTRPGSPLGLVSLSGGPTTPLPYDAESDATQRVVSQIRSQVRVYGGTTVYTREETKRGLAGVREWTDVYVARGGAMPENVSACDGDDCVEPALSPDGQRVAYVKTQD